MKYIFQISLFLFLIWNAKPLYAQFYVNMEGGLKWDILQCFASKGDFSYVNKVDFMGGATLGYQIDPYLFLEVGVHVQQLNNNYIYKLDGVDWLKGERWLPAQFLQFPIRLRTTILTISDKITLHPYLGLALLVHRHKGGRYEWREYQQMIEEPAFQSSFKYEYNASFKSKYLLLGEAGLTIKYKVAKHFNILLSAGFMMGSTAIHESLIFWERKLPAFEDQGVVNAQYKGDQVSLLLGVQCFFVD